MSLVAGTLGVARTPAGALKPVLGWLVTSAAGGAAPARPDPDEGMMREVDAVRVQPEQPPSPLPEPEPVPLLRKQLPQHAEKRGGCAIA